MIYIPHQYRHAAKGHIQTFNPIHDYDSPFFTLPINMERDDFGISTVYRLSLTQNHLGNQNLLLTFTDPFPFSIYILPYSLLQLHVFTSLPSHRKDV